MNVDNEFRSRQTLRQLAIVPLELAHLFRKRAVFGLRAASLRRQTLVALLAPVREMRRVEPLPAQQGADGSGLAGGIRLG